MPVSSEPVCARRALDVPLDGRLLVFGSDPFPLSDCGTHAPYCSMEQAHSYHVKARATVPLNLATSAAAGYFARHSLLLALPLLPRHNTQHNTHDLRRSCHNPPRTILEGPNCSNRARVADNRRVHTLAGRSTSQENKEPARAPSNMHATSCPCSTINV